ncbi:hypothetical protein [Methylosinus sp. PW1]|uniref:hypothetical protein n=1 Tax=Methylosinus sp. PW1 TaxID=107636 RepID=UPI00056BF1DD|nr:hypothetical protein [Methylosinus sp. PW1]
MSARRSSLALALLLAGCQGASVTRDAGGNLRAYMDEARRLDARGAQKAIRGVCASACTIYLGLRNVCVEPGAQLWFHAAHLPDDPSPDSLGSLEMLAFYPPRVREWVMRSGALDSTDFDKAKMLSGEALIAMGVPACRDASL